MDQVRSSLVRALFGGAGNIAGATKCRQLEVDHDGPLNSTTSMLKFITQPE